MLKCTTEFVVFNFKFADFLWQVNDLFRCILNFACFDSLALLKFNYGLLNPSLLSLEHLCVLLDLVESHLFKHDLLLQYSLLMRFLSQKLTFELINLVFVIDLTRHNR